PTGPGWHPVIGSAGVVLARDKVGLGTLDNTALPSRAADQNVDHRTRDWNRLQHASRCSKIRAKLECLPQQLVRRHQTVRPPYRIDITHKVIAAQPTMRRAGAHGRMIDESCKPRRRERGQGADIAGPCNAKKIPRSAEHARNFDMPAKAVERPVERTQ